MSIAKVFHKPLAWLSILLLGVGVAGATTRPTHHKTSSSRTSSKASSSKSAGHVTRVASKSRRNAKHKNKKARNRGQQVIDGDRARQIQTALIRERYLTGEPSGVWDQSTKDAMSRFQADHGWQTKTLPDSRALIQLGLGPSHDNTANAEAAAESPSGHVQQVNNSPLPQARQ